MLRPGTPFIPAQAVMITEAAPAAPVLTVDEIETQVAFGLGTLIDIYV